MTCILKYIYYYYRSRVSLSRGTVTLEQRDSRYYTSSIFITSRPGSDGGRTSDISTHYLFRFDDDLPCSTRVHVILL